jgi:hypothetical protein
MKNTAASPVILIKGSLPNWLIILKGICRSYGVTFHVASMVVFIPVQAMLATDFISDLRKSSQPRVKLCIAKTSYSITQKELTKNGCTISDFPGRAGSSNL